MRRFSVGLILLFCGVCAFAQQPSSATASQGAQVVVQPATDEPEDRVRKDNREPAPTELEDRDKEIRQFDPLDRDDNQTAADKAKEQKAEQQSDDRQKPLPGSVAASDARTAAEKSDGPQVIGEGETAGATSGYAGPAVLSHSYSINSSLIPENLLWTEFFGVSNVYDSGMNAAGTGPQGSVQNAAGLGWDFKWGISGRHQFRRGSLGLAYSGDRPWYSSGSQFTGLNSKYAVDYTYFLSRRLSIKATGTGSIFSQSYALQTQVPGPETPAADVNVSTTSPMQVFDNGMKTFTFGLNASWQQSARLSFTAGASYFDTIYNNPTLIGVTGQQAQGNVSYRLTSRTTVGVFYSYSVYTFPHHQGISNSDSIGGLYSYAINRSTRVQLRAGGGISETHALQSVPLNPVAAALFGLQSEIIEGYYRGLNQDLSGSLAKDFSSGRETVTLSYTKGISPGNGIYLTAVSETIAVSAAMKLFGRYPISVAVGRQTFTSAAQATGNYQSDYVHISSSRPVNRNLMLIFGADYHYYQIAELSGLRNEVALNCGFTWTRSENRLWPLW